MGLRWVRVAAIVFSCAAALLVSAGAGAATKNGFDLRGALVPENEILHGGPAKDGIPAIDQPRFVAARDAAFLKPDARVLGIALGGAAKAYPIAILNWHEVVNDELAGTPLVVTFCPLCGTGTVFRGTVAGRTLRFGVSGLLYNSNVLLYDRQTQSLWSQIMAQAVTGPYKGQRLEFVAVSHTSWADWRARHPQTLVLSPDTGFSRDYARNPYAGYERSEEVMFRVRETSQRYHPKELVVGVNLNGQAKAYPFVELQRAKGPVQDTVGGQGMTVVFDSVHRSARVLDAAGQELPSVTGFWFAWVAFHPKTEVYAAPQKSSD